MSDAQNYDVVIVGGGPVGMGLAIELGQRAVRCVVVERFEQPQPIPKGQNLTQRTMEHFYFWGAERQLRAARTIPPEYGIGGLTAYGTLLGPYAYDWLQRDRVQPYYFQRNERLPQYATESVLRNRVSELSSVTALYGWSAETIVENDAGVAIDVVEREGGGRRTLHAQYVVGCDGSRSVVRQQAGITQALSAHDRLMVLLVFRSHRLHELLARYPGKSYYNVLHPELKGYWKFLGRVDLGGTWFFHAPVPLGTTKDNFDFREFLHEAIGADFDVEFQHIGFWDLRFALADSYRAGRVFIAGDAAHSHPPYGGYGVNSGFEDARNIGWKLAATLQGWGSSGLLDSYEFERRPVFASTIRDFIAKAIDTDREFLESYDPARDRAAFERAWNARATEAQEEVNAFEPNYEGSTIVADKTDGRPRAVGTHCFAARTGHHLAPALLSSRRSVFEELGPGFTLIDFTEGAEAPRFQASAAELGIPLTCISDTPHDDRKRYEAKLILVRPDQFVAWTGEAEPSDPSAILRRAVGGD